MGTQEEIGGAGEECAPQFPVWLNGSDTVGAGVDLASSTSAISAWFRNPLRRRPDFRPEAGLDLLRSWGGSLGQESTVS